jgi:predicted alpha/beta-fold hydrolase
MRLPLALAALLAAAATLAATASAGTSPRFQTAVQQILAQPYQPNYVPQGYDTAFGDADVLNTAPAQDYTTGSIPGSPDAPAWPAWFRSVQFTSGDGAPLLGQLALHAVDAPGIVVVHGFNTHGYASVIRWAAMLYANGYDVLAADQRDFSFEYAAGFGYPKWQQTFGWKESDDVVAAGGYLAAQRGTKDIGLVGFSEGGQNTVLALALDAGRIFKSAIQFSGPADQDTQIYSTAVPAGCQTPFCTYPVTDSLVQLVVPPYDNGDVCTALARAGALYGADGFGILAHETAFHAQQSVKVPLLNLYSADDSLVPAFEAQMMAGYEVGNALQRTLEVTRGEHAYFFDRWWQERAILLYFKNTLASASGSANVTTAPTVNQTAGGLAFGDQLVPLTATKASADALLAPYVCATGRGAPGAG